MKNPTTLAIVALVSALAVACGGAANTGAKREARVESGSTGKPTASAPKRSVASSQSAARGARDSSGDDDVVVNVRNRDTARADLALVASCGDRNYPQAKDASTRPECDAALGAHETRSQP